MKLAFGILVSSGEVFGKEPSFYDEFDDLSNWIVHNVPDSYNNEYQYYTDRNVNVRTEDGYLKITPLRWVLKQVLSDWSTGSGLQFDSLRRASLKPSKRKISA